MRWRSLLILVALAALDVALVGPDGTAAPLPAVQQIEVAVATHLAHSRDYVVSFSYFQGLAPHPYRGHAWVDETTGDGRWIGTGASGRIASTRVMGRDGQQPTFATVTFTTIDYRARSWMRDTRLIPVSLALLHFGDPFSHAPHFTLLGSQEVDGQQALHLRSDYVSSSGKIGRWSVWVAPATDLLVRYQFTSRTGVVLYITDFRWLPRTPASLALLKLGIPSDYRRVASRS